MSEKKACPFLLAGLLANPDPPFIDRNMDGRRLCREGECALWRTTRNGRATDMGFYEDEETTGYCGLAGRP